MRKTQAELNEEYIQAVKAELDNPTERSDEAPVYDWIGPTSLGLMQRCTDCGCLVLLADRNRHDQFHFILNSMATEVGKARSFRLTGVRSEGA